MFVPYNYAVCNGQKRLSDKDELPFTVATLLEIQRFGSSAPLGGFHCCGRETTVDGYNIPKGSLVLANLWNVLHDPNTWKIPDEFNPERFLENDGSLRAREEFIPFSIGKTIKSGKRISINRMALIPQINRSNVRPDSTLLF